jgi:antitoxin CcdA
VFEAGLAEAIRRRQSEEWLRKNRDALDAYNEHVERHGVFSDALRSF